MEPSIRLVTPADAPAVLGLLGANRLPEAGLDAHWPTVLVAELPTGQIVGSAGLELYGADALLRSVATAAAHRAGGLGSRLVDRALALAADRGVEAVYLLTETAPGFFARRGFLPVARREVPAGVRQSVEFRGACCQTALAMWRALRTPAADGRGYVVRAATGRDLAAMTAIYNQGIEGRVGTFETRLRTPDDLHGWFDGAHPHLVVERDGHVVGFGSTSAYRPARACYDAVAEFSVYVERTARRQGAGRSVMEGLLHAAERGGFVKLVSRVFVENEASRRLLRALGFREVGIYEKHGRLDGRWRDVVIVERLFARNSADCL
jgi:phosphinothricin acetyltransferase